MQRTNFTAYRIANTASGCPPGTAYSVLWGSSEVQHRLPYWAPLAQRTEAHRELVMRYSGCCDGWRQSIGEE